MPINTTHEGLDPMGAPTLHRGTRDDCNAPECPDPIPEPDDSWGAYCPHGKQIVERDPDHTDPEGRPVGRIVDPWPCTVDGCTLERFEAEQQAEEAAYWDTLNSEMHT